MRTHALILAGLMATLVGCGDDNAQLVCERLDACGCLSESVDQCEERIADLDEDQLEVCGHCLSTNDHLCHELVANHGACRGCTDDFASKGKGRDLFERGVGAGSGGVRTDVEVSCIDVAPDAGTP